MLLFKELWFVKLYSCSILYMTPQKGLAIKIIWKPYSHKCGKKTTSKYEKHEIKTEQKTISENYHISIAVLNTVRHYYWLLLLDKNQLQLI